MVTGFRSVPLQLARATLAISLVLLVATLAFAPPASAGSDSWTRLGLTGKSLMAVGASPVDPNLLLATDGSAVYRSADRGKTWATVVESISRSDSINRFVFDPRDPGIAYAVGTRLYESKDGGKTWAETDLPSMSIFGFALDPRSPGTLYIGNNGTPPGPAAIVKSVDSGKTWQPTDLKVDAAAANKPGGQDTPLVFVVAVDPTDSSYLVAVGLGKGDRAAHYRSADGGKTWQQVSPSAGQTLPLASQLAFAADGAVLFAAGRDVSRSLDRGQTWQTALSRTGGFLRALPNPSNAAEVFAWASSDQPSAASTVYRSADKGATFSPFAVPSGGKGLHDLAFDRASPQTLYAATEDGVWAYTLEKSAAATPTAVATATPTSPLVPTATATALPTRTPIPTATTAPAATPTAQPAATPTQVSAPTATVAPTRTATSTPTPSPADGPFSGQSLIIIGGGAVLVAIGALVGRRLWRRSG
jgi:photosystem II stability/assembly factor-like uncharacterized protein